MYTFDFGIYGLPLAITSKELIVVTTTVTYCYCKPEIR